jgi:tRNA threonylcarbamoyl adenosine modification protein YeaZ
MTVGIEHRNILAIETAIAGGSICLSCGGRTVAEWAGAAERPQAEYILDRVSELFDSEAARVRPIDTVAVSAGPGSFTGIRIGISSGLGLARGLEAKILTVNILDALAFFYRDIKNSFFLLPIGRGKSIFCPPLENGSHDPAAVSAFRVVPNDKIPDLLRSADFKGPCLYHPSLEEYIANDARSRKLNDNLACAVAAFASSSDVRISAPVFVSSSGMQ